MNVLDLLLVALAGAAAVGGWRLGFVRRASGWLGVGAGVFLAILAAPRVVRWLDLTSDFSIVVVVTSLLVLLASVGQGIGALIGTRLHQEVDSTAVRHADAVGGAALGVVAVAVMAWLVVPVMADAEGWTASATRDSRLAQWITTYLPPPPPQIEELERQLVGGGYPQLFAELQRAPDIPAAPSDSPVTQEMLDSVAPSAVRLRATACRNVQSGSGFFVGEGLLVTNAHVVAGSDRLELETATGSRGIGVVVSFDPAVDLALVRTDLTAPPLRIAAPREGDQGLVLGFPGGGPFAPSPFEVGELLDARGFDIYDARTVDREILALAAALEPGDSGSAVLRQDGTVIGVAVAVAPDRPDVAYALNSSELRSLLSGPASAPADTGPCTS